MTSLAFGFGVLPLAFSTGAGAGGRQLHRHRRCWAAWSRHGRSESSSCPLFFVRDPEVFGRNKPADCKRTPPALPAARGHRAREPLMRTHRGSRPHLRCAPAALLAGLREPGAPTYAQPAAPVPAAWASAPADRRRRRPPRATWAGAFFIDERLRQVVVDSRLANNRDLRVAALNIERAQAQYRIARAGAVPVDGRAARWRARTPAQRVGQRAATHRDAVQRRAGPRPQLRDRPLRPGEQPERRGAGEPSSRWRRTARSAQISLVAEVATAWLTLAADTERLAARARDAEEPGDRLRPHHAARTNWAARRASSWHRRA